MNLCCGLLGTAGPVLVDGRGRLRSSAGARILPAVFPHLFADIKSMSSSTNLDLTSGAGGNLL